MSPPRPLRPRPQRRSPRCTGWRPPPGGLVARRRPLLPPPGRRSPPTPPPALPAPAHCACARPRSPWSGGGGAQAESGGHAALGTRLLRARSGTAPAGTALPRGGRGGSSRAAPRLGARARAFLTTPPPTPTPPFAGSGREGGRSRSRRPGAGAGLGCASPPPPFSAFASLAGEGSRSPPGAAEVTRCRRCRLAPGGRQAAPGGLGSGSPPCCRVPGRWTCRERRRGAPGRGRPQPEGAAGRGRERGRTRHLCGRGKRRLSAGPFPPFGQHRGRQERFQEHPVLQSRGDRAVRCLRCAAPLPLKNLALQSRLTDVACS